MALVSLSVYELDGRRYYDYQSHSYKDRTFTMKDEDTYLVIFGPDQTLDMEKFEEKYADHIIFKSKKACNTNYKNGPRNTLFIFEKKLETSGKVPTV
jgi:hypothetical protein